MLDSFALAVETTFNPCNWLNNAGFNDMSYCLADLNCPNVLTKNISKLEIRTGAKPTGTLSLLNDIIHAFA